jgi:hypothetical protein
LHWYHKRTGEAGSFWTSHSQCSKNNPWSTHVNDTNIKLAPQETVREIGNVFQQVIALLDSAALDEVVMLEKRDLSDRFWRMLVQEAKQWNFAYGMPNLPGSPVYIVLPAALQMGWVESPAYF